MKSHWLTTTLAYALLVVGSLVFSFPFVWMVTTSLKVDRELQSEGLDLTPVVPLPRARSPYIDDRFFPDLPGPAALQAQVLPHLEALVGEHRPEIPAHLDPDQACQQIARGLYKRLHQILPADLWSGIEVVTTVQPDGKPLRQERVLPPDEAVRRLREAMSRRVDAALVREVLAQVHRELRFGPLRAVSVDLQDQVLGGELPVSQRWTCDSPDRARLVDGTQAKLPDAAVHYDVSSNKAPIAFTGTYELRFPVRDLRWLTFDIRPDDTWQELHVTIEKEGRVFVPRRPVILANFTPTAVTWQEASEDDTSTKIKTWVVIDPVEGRTSEITGPHQVRLRVELHPVSQTKAIANKVSLNYERVADFMPFWRYLRVSLFLVIANIVLTVFASSLVAYAFARLNWPGRDFCFVLMLATLMIPGQVTMIPHFLIWRALGLYNTLTPLWLGSAFGSAFFIFMLRQFLKTIPRDLEDAARIDGCGYLRIYWHVMLPLVKPSLAAIAIFTFMGTWNDFMGPLIYVADQRLYPLAFGLYAFSVQVGNNPALTMAASLLMTLPVIAIFFFAQKYFIQGVTLTGIKG